MTEISRSPSATLRRSTIWSRADCIWKRTLEFTREEEGAAFANTEMDVVLRTILRHFAIETDNARDEKMPIGGLGIVAERGE